MSAEDGEFPHPDSHERFASDVHILRLLFFVVVAFRFLVHRYSVMREHVEANKIEGVDDIDSHYMETGKAQYNEDSDQVFIFSLLV